MMDVQFIVRWSDGKKTCYKVYDDENVVRQAKAWLVENGAKNVDIAVRINKKQYKLVQAEKLDKGE